MQKIVRTWTSERRREGEREKFSFPCSSRAQAWNGAPGIGNIASSTVLCIPNAYQHILMHRMHGQLIYSRNKPSSFSINRKLYWCSRLETPPPSSSFLYTLSSRTFPPVPRSLSRSFFSHSRFVGPLYRTHSSRWTQPETSLLTSAHITLFPSRIAHEAQSFNCNHVTSRLRFLHLIHFFLSFLFQVRYAIALIVTSFYHSRLSPGSPSEWVDEQNCIFFIKFSLILQFRSSALCKLYC